MKSLTSVDKRFSVAARHWVAIDGDTALINDLIFGPHGITSIYLKRGGRWHYIAQSGAGAEPCLFAKTRLQDGDVERLRGRLYWLMLTTSPFSPSQQNADYPPIPVGHCSS